jgi:hypothetical protein
VRARLHLSPLAEVLALVATASLVPVDLVGPLQGLQVSELSGERVAWECKMPVVVFLVTPRGLQPTDLLGCPVAPARPHGEWLDALATVRETFEEESSCLLFVEDEVDAQTLVTLIDQAIGAGFPSVTIAPERVCRSTPRPWPGTR